VLSISSDRWGSLSPPAG